MSEQTTSESTAPVTQTQEPVATEATPEPQVPETPATPEPEVQQTDMHKRFQALSKREKLLQEKAARQAAEFQAREAEITKKLQELRHLEELKAKLEQFENPQEPETTDQRVERLEKMLREKEESEKQKERENQERIQQESVRAAIDSYQQSMADAASKNPDAFELFNSNQEQALELALEVAKQYYRETESILPPEDAIQYVEEYLEEQYQNQYQRMLTLKKLKAKNPPVPEVEQPPVKEKPKTLTNNNASGSAIAPTPREVWDPEKSKAKAAELLKWND